MEEQNVQPTTEETTPPADAQPAGETESPKAADWRENLSSVDPDELLRHPRVAGIVGSRIDQAIRRREEQIRTEERRKIEVAREEEFVRLARENPETLREKYPGVLQWVEERQTARAREAEEERAKSIRESYNRQLAESYQRVPEWAEFKQEDVDRISKAMIDVPDDQAIGAFNSVVADIITEKRAEKKAEAKLAARLEQERQAIRQEERARALSNEDGPDVKRPLGRQPKVDVRKMDEAQFDKWWESVGKKVR